MLRWTGNATFLGMVTGFLTPTLISRKDVVATGWTELHGLEVKKNEKKEKKNEIGTNLVLRNPGNSEKVPAQKEPPLS